MLPDLVNTRYLQYVAAIAASLVVTSSNMYLSWTSPMLPLLQSKDSPIGITLTENEASWVASAHSLGAIITGPLVGYLLEILGRRTVLIVSAGILFFPWFFAIFANSFWMLIVFRFIGGMGITISGVGVSIYNADIADPDIRGRLGILILVVKLFGTILVLCVGPFISYTALGILGAAMPVLSLICFLPMPESPYHLISKKKNEEARKTLIRLSPKNIDQNLIDQKLIDIERLVERNLKNKKGFKEFIRMKEYRKPFFINIMIKSLQILSGNSVMNAYMQTIIEISGSSIPADISSVIFGIVKLPAAIIALFTVDRYGRKPLLIISALGCAIAHYSEGTYFYLQDFTDKNIDSISWLPTTAMVGYIFISNFGIVSIPPILQSEMFPTNIKATANVIIMVWGQVLAFFANKMYSPISEAWGTCTAFWIFGSFCLAGMCYVIAFLPETKGKSFSEIQEMLGGKLKKKVSKDKLYLSDGSNLASTPLNSNQN